MGYPVEYDFYMFVFSNNKLLQGSGITVVREDEADAVGHQTVNLNKNAKSKECVTNIV